MVLSKRKVDLTSGALFSAIVRFAIPLMIGSLIQLLFNAVDIMVLSQVADNNAVLLASLSCRIEILR